MVFKNFTFCKIKYVHVIVWPSPPSISRLSSLVELKLYPREMVTSHFALPRPLATTIGTFCLWIWLLWVPLVTGIVECLSFCVWLISLSTLSPRFIHAAACARISFLKAAWYSIVCMYVCSYMPHFAYSSVHWWTLRLVFPLLWTVPLHIGVCKYQFIFSTFGYIPRCGIAGWCSNSMFNFLRNLPTVFQSSCNIWHYFQQCPRVPISPYPHQHFLFSGFCHLKFNISHVNGCSGQLVLRVQNKGKRIKHEEHAR